MKKQMRTWTFVIEDAGSLRRALGDRLTITEAGCAKLWLGGELAGAFKANNWTRIYVEPNQLEPK